jgi:hypothetical protein
MGESPVNRPWPTVSSVGRREFLLSGAALFTPCRADQLDPIVVSVQAMFDQGARSGRGLGDHEISLFNSWQDTARRNYAVSGIRFDVHVLQGAYLRTQGYSEIPEKFLVPNMINLFVTDTLGYDIDEDRTGGVSIGPVHPAAGPAVTHSTKRSWACATLVKPRWNTNTPITSRWIREIILRRQVIFGPIYVTIIGSGVSATVPRYPLSAPAPIRHGLPYGRYWHAPPPCG